MLIKHGVRTSVSLQDPILCILPKLESIYHRYGHECVITSAVEGRHKEGSKHYEGLAIDIRIRFFNSQEQKNEVFLKIQAELGPDYDVVLHDTHIHIEYDPKV
tara:strand:- start:1389 stop:1697 length:309 start_codon:yes stop_codon:yes gene_type:complete